MPPPEDEDPANEAQDPTPGRPTPGRWYEDTDVRHVLLIILGILVLGALLSTCGDCTAGCVDP
ncbi:hypothetical protein [Streptomyces sp. NPDC097619]|uniref:hypothetical protein n=1 Tax=Streptomyces sp. NPDC097619 TaxID=3157228 RepID=UPI0033283B6E